MKSILLNPLRQHSSMPAASSAWAGLGVVCAILITVVAVTPLALIPGVFLSHDIIPKLFLILTGAALLLVLQPRWSPGLRILWGQTTGRLFLLLVAAQFLSLLISTLFSPQIPLSVGGTLWRRFGLLEQAAALVVATAVTCVVALRPAWTTALFRAISVCGGLAACYGILQYFRMDPFLSPALYSIEYFGGVLRPPSTMGHALYFSAYLAPIVFISASLALFDAGKSWRRVHTGVVVLACIAIFLSGTRSALLAIAAGGIVFGWRKLRSRESVPEPGYSVGLSVLLALAITVVFVLSPAGQTLRNRMLQEKTETGGPRLQMWREVPALIGHHALIGIGPETFAVEFRKIQSAKLSRAYPDYYNETPHNAFIDAACAQGIPGFLILAGVFALGGFAIYSGAAGRNPVMRNPVMVGVEAALVAIFVSAMFASFTLVSSLYLWSIAGIAVVLMFAETGQEPVLRFQFPRLPAVLAACVFFFFAVSLPAQDAAWARLGSAVGRGSFANAGKAYSNAIFFSAGLPSYELFASREMAVLGRTLGDTKDGAACWIKAGEAAAIAETQSEERFSAAYQLSLLAVAAGNLPQADVKARETIRLAPNWYRGHDLMSQILQMAGHSRDAVREAMVSDALRLPK
jgi:O-antigen ligase